MTDGATVFVVDDDAAARDSLKMLLSAFEFDVKLFESAEAFLESYDTTHRGCLLVDMRLRGMSGRELHKTLLADGNNLPIILISGFMDQESACEAKADGAVAVLDKPIDSRKLVEHIRAAINRCE